jgi:hypothetical protein
LCLGLWDPFANPSIRAGTSVRSLECLAIATRATCPVSAFNLAKVGVEGSNPFARSNFLQINQRPRRTVEGFVCFPAAGPEAGEAEGKQPKAKRPAIMP